MSLSCNSLAAWDVRAFPVVQPVGAGPLGRIRDAPSRKSSGSGSGVAAAIPLDRHRDDVAVPQQLGDADKHIAAGEMTGALAYELAKLRAQVSNERHLVLFRSIQPRRAAQKTANVAQSYAEVAQRRACFRAVSCGFGLNPRLPGRGTLPAEAFCGRDRWITDVTSWNLLLSGDAAREKTKNKYASACQS